MKNKLFLLLLIVTAFNKSATPQQSTFAAKEIMFLEKCKQSILLESITNNAIGKNEITVLQTALPQESFDQPDIAFANCLCARACLQDGTVLGVAIFETQADQKTIDLIFLGTKPSYQKNGIATALINYIVKTTCCKNMIVSSYLSARSFYLHLGFNETKPNHFEKIFKWGDYEQ